HVRHRAAGGVVKIQVKRRGDETLAGAARTAQFGGDGHLLAPVDGHLVEKRGARTDVVPPDALAERSGLRESGTARPPAGRSRGAFVTPAASSGGSVTAASSSSQSAGDVPAPSGSARSTAT